MFELPSSLYKKNINKFLNILPVLSIIVFLLNCHIGCQEKLYNTTESPSLAMLQSLCPPGDVNKNIQYTKYFGPGTFCLVIILAILYFR